MKLTLHHVNLCTTNLPQMDTFYRDILGLDMKPGSNAVRVKNEGYEGDVAFLTDGEMEVHLAEKDLGVSFRTGKAVNPLERGHIAFRTDDIASFKKRLDEKGVPYADFGGWAMSGWHQIFFYDPDGNVIKVHQVDSE